VISLIVALGLSLLAFAVRPVARIRSRRAAAKLERRASFRELLAQAARERIQRQVQAEGDEIPWR
jgi:hypothetical protein